MLGLEILPHIVELPPLVVEKVAGLAVCLDPPSTDFPKYFIGTYVESVKETKLLRKTVRKDLKAKHDMISDDLKARKKMTDKDNGSKFTYMSDHSDLLQIEGMVVGNNLQAVFEAEAGASSDDATDLEISSTDTSNNGNNTPEHVLGDQGSEKDSPSKKNQ